MRHCRFWHHTRSRQDHRDGFLASEADVHAWRFCAFTETNAFAAVAAYEREHFRITTEVVPLAAVRAREWWPAALINPHPFNCGRDLGEWNDAHNVVTLTTGESRQFAFAPHGPQQSGAVIIAVASVKDQKGRPLMRHMLATYLPVGRSHRRKYYPTRKVGALFLREV